LTRKSVDAILNYMVNYSSGVLDATFGALADPTRRAILARLARGEAMVTELAEPFHVSLPAISKHLRVL
jgi:DNA-binding transcriptional ArsR family regulator